MIYWVWVWIAGIHLDSLGKLVECTIARLYAFVIVCILPTA